MPSKVCSCGNKINSISQSLKCFDCREKLKCEKKQQVAQKRFDERKAAGLILLHSCVSNGLLDPAPETCLCRKLVTESQAKRLVEIGRVVDWETRNACFRGGPVVEKSRLKSVPMSTLGSRIAIERTIVRADLSEKEIARMRAVAEDDRAARHTEQKYKIDIEHAIAIEEQKKLIVFVDEEVFDEMKKQSWGRPDRFSTTEERTSLGRDVGTNRGPINATDEYEEPDDATPTDAEHREHPRDRIRGR